MYEYTFTSTHAQTHTSLSPRTLTHYPHSSISPIYPHNLFHTPTFLSSPTLYLHTKTHLTSTLTPSPQHPFPGSIEVPFIDPNTKCSHFSPLPSARPPHPCSKYRGWPLFLHQGAAADYYTHSPLVGYECVVLPSAARGFSYAVQGALS